MSVPHVFFSSNLFCVFCERIAGLRTHMHAHTLSCVLKSVAVPIIQVRAMGGREEEAGKRGNEMDGRNVGMRGVKGQRIKITTP